MKEVERNLNMKDRDQTRFCKDVQHRSDSRYVEFGHLHLYYFSPVTGDADFFQEYYFGDLQHCEQYGFDKMGRSAQL